MPTVEERPRELGYTLPQLLKLLSGIALSFPWVRVAGASAIIFGHGPTGPDGSLAQPLGKVGTQVTFGEAYVAARLTDLPILGSLKRELRTLERIE